MARLSYLSLGIELASVDLSRLLAFARDWMSESSAAGYLLLFASSAFLFLMIGWNVLGPRRRAAAKPTAAPVETIRAWLSRADRRGEESAPISTTDDPRPRSTRGATTTGSPLDPRFNDRLVDGEHPEVLLTTKLSIPRPRSQLVPRLRLARLLDEGTAGPLTVISAPAGFGKTTLVTAWCAAQSEGRTIAWVSLDPADNDPARFWAYVIAAVDAVRPGDGEDAWALLRASSQAEITPILAALINAVATTPGETVLVLDDYHLVTAPAIHEALIFLLEHLPPQLHVLIASRSEPPIALARFRARGELTELRASDLRFSQDEVAAFVKEVVGLQLARDDVATLQTGTEGWVAGLHLATLSMQGRDREQVSRFIQSFTGGHHYILTYLAEEVFQQQPEEIQHFLLQTSVLDRLEASLCNALTGRQDSQQMLDRLDRANLFLIPLDDEHRWYRYHQLFVDFLRAQARRLQPHLGAELHARASRWYERNGMFPEAIEHALAASTWPQAARLINENARTMFHRGEELTLHGWLEALPKEVVQGDAQLSIFYAWTLLHAVGAAAAALPLADAEQVLGLSVEEAAARPELPPPHVATPLGEVAIIRSHLARMARDIPRAAWLCEQALRLLPEPEVGLRSIVALNLGAIERVTGDLEGARRRLNEALRLGQAAGKLDIVVLALCDLGLLQRMQGQLHRAAQTFRRAMRVAGESDGTLIPIAAIPRLYLGDLLYEWNELDEAERALVKGLSAIVEELATMDLLIGGTVALAFVKQAQGHPQRSLELIARAEQVGHEYHCPVDEVGAAQARLWMMQGNGAAALRWGQRVISAAQHPHQDETAPDEYRLDGAGPTGLQGGGLAMARPLRPYESMTLARVLIHHGQAQEAAQLLDRLFESDEVLRDVGNVIEMRVLQALAWSAQGRSDLALERLAQALLLAAPEGYVRTFLDEGAPLGVLLVQALKASRNGGTQLNGTAATYAATLLAALEPDSLRLSKSHDSRRVEAPSIHRTSLQPFDTLGAGSSTFEPSIVLVEPLTERELDILRLLAAGHS
ncbi:MAG TPA: tetratricopeptide repeat protein, partial [Ardenticatenaceae bacterium]|nr:tetratricopeptide repeat protein [Ardenticatenaceae bacterium]